MSAKSKIVVVGTGGLAREFHAWFGDEVDIVGFSADREDSALAALLPGERYDNNVSPDVAGTDQCVIAISSPEKKMFLHELLSKRGWRFATLVHSSAVLAPTVALGEGVVISPRVVVGANAVIGSLSYLNFQAGIGHDAVIGPYCQINPGAQVGGAARMERGVLLGSNSALLQGVKIGAGATVGLGAVCLTRVRPGATVVGNPAKPWQFG